MRIKDFGIRGFDLALALDTAGIVILVDAVGMGWAPGTIYTIEPDAHDVPRIDVNSLDAHSMDPGQVLRLAKQMNLELGRILLVGCEPATFGPDGEGQIGLSPPVEGAVDRAVELIESMIAAWRESGQESLAMPSYRMDKQQQQSLDDRIMCLAIPGKIVELVPGADPLALVDVMGVRRRVDVSMVLEQGLEIGDWVLFHVGFAMSKISEEAAGEQIRLLLMLGEADAALEEVRGYGSAKSPPPDAWPGRPPDS